MKYIACLVVLLVVIVTACIDTHISNIRIERCSLSIDNEVTVYGRVYTCGRYL